MLSIYDSCAFVPDNAKKPILAGRLKGKTDINPMWRIKMLTSLFGPAGQGWKTENVRYSTHTNHENDEVIVICELDLLYRIPADDVPLASREWSAPLYGIGGNTLLAREKGYTADGRQTKVLFSDDEAYKKAYTDAIGVACKSLGIGASVYWEQDNTKYTPKQPQRQPAQNVTVTKTIPPEAPPVYDPAPQINAIMQRFNIDKNGFSNMRKALIDGGVVEDKPSKAMTQQDWEKLFKAIDANFGEAAS